MTHPLKTADYRLITRKVVRFGIPLAFLSLILLFILLVLLSPTFNQRMGNVFFGEFKPLYSVQVAGFFFQKAAYPVRGTPLPWASYQLGRVAFITGDLDKAIKEFDRELALFPSHYKTYYMKGLTLGYMDREEEAIGMFSLYIENTSDTWASYNDKAWLQFRIGDIDGALATIEPVAKQQPSNPWVANTYGVLLMNTGRYAEAEASFLTGLEKLATMTEDDWGVAYPGNDPRIYSTGLRAMRTSYEDNLALVREKLAGH
jgi:tetratricopeptide (TPR) repeat protein